MTQQIDQRVEALIDAVGDAMNCDAWGYHGFNRDDEEVNKLARELTAALAAAPAVDGSVTRDQVRETVVAMRNAPFEMYVTDSWPAVESRIVDYQTKAICTLFGIALAGGPADGEENDAE